MRSSIIFTLGVVSTASALPGMGADFNSEAARLLRRQNIPTILPASEVEPNSGPFPNLNFNAADQFVDVRPGTQNEYRAPGKNDKRGPCPGLNAAANHGFLPRSGIPNIQQTITGLEKAYSFGPDVSTILAVIAVGLTGDPIAETWSIGGPYPASLGGALLSNPGGISWSHNAYESDASATRSDAYLNGGDAASLNLTRFDKLYFRTTSFTLDELRNHNKFVYDESIQNNPYFFSGPFAGLVPPIAHHFLVNMMSNHSSDQVQGYLDRNILKQFFSVSGPDNKHTYQPGQERIPLNWYKRPSANPYGLIPTLADVLILAKKYPDIIRIGGNTGKVNTFTGINLGDLTGGVFNSATLLQGNNLGCFIFQAGQQLVPDFLSGVVKNLSPVIQLLNKYISPVTKTLNCPALLKLDQSHFNQFPGAKYRPKPSK